MDFTTFALVVLFVLACAYVLSQIVFGSKARKKQPADSYFHHGEPAEIVGEMEEAIEAFRAKREVERQRAENARNAPPPIPLDKIERRNPYEGVDLSRIRSYTRSQRQQAAQPRSAVAAKLPPRPAGTGRVSRSSSHHTTIVDDGSAWTNWSVPDTSGSSNCSSSSSSSSDTSSSSCPTD